MSGPGTLYGLGAGPGDPELITLKALRILRRCPTIAYPAPESGESMTRAIVAPHLPGGQREIRIPMPLEPERFPSARVYDEAAAEIDRELARGRDVAAIAQGDPFLYGSFMYLYARLAERHAVVVVPGVSSLTACAAAAGAPLAARNDVLVVIPAPLPADVIRARLADAEAAVIVKLGRHFAKVRAVLDSLGLTEGARCVVHATLPDERVEPVADVDPESVPYFSTVLVHRRGRAWR